jgi:hypothetical protein
VRQVGTMENNHPLTMGEQNGITISTGDTGVIREKGDQCLIGRVWTEKKITREVFETILSRLW